ncbi:MAG: zinc ABC transporter substrate-binding protein [Spirochaetales bacterium]|nr:zinc ABC transporter substrate-binding protein [Spirochaetales bacterium]
MDTFSVFRKGLIALIAATIVVPSAWASGQKEGEGGLSVVASTSIVWDVVRSVAGTDADVFCLIEPGTDPHGYEPAPREIAKAESADIVFVNGLDLEENLLTLLENVRPGGVVEVSSRVNAIENESGKTGSGGEDEHDGEDSDAGHPGEHEAGDDHHHRGDPHTWMSPLNVLTWVDVIEETLSAADPAHRENYSSRADQYRTLLLDLHRRIEDAVSQLPAENRILVTDHHTLGYFARDYGFTVIGSILPGFSSNTEPSVRDLTRLIDIINEYQVTAIFIGQTAGGQVDKLSRTIEKSLGKSLDVRTLFTGSLAAAGETGDSYMSFMEYNVAEIVEGLGGLEGAF